MDTNEGLPDNVIHAVIDSGCTIFGNIKVIDLIAV
jgi:hypothetical protein